MQKKFIAAVAFLFVFVLLMSAQAGTFRQTVTLTAGSGSLTLAPVYNTVATGVRLEAIVFTTTAPATNTASFVVGTVTNAIGTKAVTATDRTLAATSAPSLFMGDLVIFTSSSTNTHTLYVIGEEF
jgi:hypothetical protein